MWVLVLGGKDPQNGGREGDFTPSGAGGSGEVGTMLFEPSAGLRTKLGPLKVSFKIWGLMKPPWPMGSQGTKLIPVSTVSPKGVTAHPPCPPRV